MEELVIDKELEKNNIAELASEYNVASKARLDAQTNEPFKDAKFPSEFETSLIESFQDRLNKFKTANQIYLSKLETKIRNTNIHKALIEANEIPDTLNNKLIKLRINEKKSCDAALELIESSKRDLNLFKNVNGLEREAKKTGSYSGHFCVLMLALVIEATLNSTFYALANEGGWIGGLFIALIVSSLNILVGILIGHFSIRWLNHAQFKWLISGGFTAFIGAIVCIQLSLFAGHYRGALEKDPVTAVNLAVQSYIESPLGIDSVNGWILAAFGVLITLLTAIKQYYYQDPYPEFSNVSETHDESIESWRDISIAYTTDLKDIASQVRLKLTELDHNASLELETFSTLLHNAKNLNYSISDYKNEQKTMCGELIMKYRTSNKAVRSAAAPVYFNTPPRVNLKYEELDIDLTVDKKRLDKDRKAFLDFRKEGHQKLIRSINQIEKDNILEFEKYVENKRI